MASSLQLESSGRDAPEGILSLPPELLENIISYLSYETASNMRLVSRSFERACRRRLNQGFSRSERFVATALKALRSQLPRRESERREHPLSRRVEHLTAVETRLGLLSMTYRRYMETDACCFIPGKVLDEVFRVVQYLRVATQVERSSFSLLQELRDISSMAMEHFEEHIVPTLKRADPRPRPISLISLFTGGTSKDEEAGGCSAWGMGGLDSLLQRSSSESRNKSLAAVEQSVTRLTQQLTVQKARSTTQSQQLAELRQTSNEQAEKLVAQDLLISDLTTKLARVEERLRVNAAGRAPLAGEGEGAAPSAPAAKPARKRPARAAAAPAGEKRARKL